jgi:hypothetical protein
MADEAFTVRLDKSDWNSGIGGWRCPALKIPGATISKVYVSGKPIDASFYQSTSDETIRWIPDNPPPQISVLISLTKSLSLRSETDFWQKIGGCCSYHYSRDIWNCGLLNSARHESTRTGPSRSYAAYECLPN